MCPSHCVNAGQHVESHLEERQLLLATTAEALRLWVLISDWSSLMYVTSAEAPTQVALRPSLGPTPGTRPGTEYHGHRPLLLPSPASL
ncbi:hypothetical protein E2C01_040208 [Portunus trituberculatus]|uniref:Uncharacterized protein n=1 Tax=Portunus trituberculatus TaxID=210409 RepID=A0A5B7FNC7_PORTR|nr:hypothetical protein [Portunus trituberculatus]